MNAPRALLRRDLDTVSEAMTPYYLDVDDDVLPATEWGRIVARDLVATTWPSAPNG
jgi:hypothetical protein